MRALEVVLVLFMVVSCWLTGFYIGKVTYQTSDCYVTTPPAEIKGSGQLGERLRKELAQ